MVLANTETADSNIITRQQDRLKVLPAVCHKHGLLPPNLSNSQLGDITPTPTTTFDAPITSLNDTSDANDTDPRCQIMRNDLRYLFVNDHFGFIYCEVPKVASTQWKRIMIALSGRITTERVLGYESK